MSRVRDTQKTNLYRAESAAFPEYKAVRRTITRDGRLRRASAAHPGALWFGSTIECEVWVNRVLRNPRAEAAVRKVMASFGTRLWSWPLRVRVTHSQGVGGARGGAGVISVSAYCRNALILLHELAHCIVPYNVAGHGREYAAAYLALVRAVLGVKAHDRLRDAFKSGGVKFRPKRVLSPERRAAAIARLAACRAPKAAVTPTLAPAPERQHDIALALADS